MICATAGVEYEPLYERFALRTCTTLDLKLLSDLHDRRLVCGGAKANGSLHGGWTNSLVRLHFANDRPDKCFQIYPCLAAGCTPRATAMSGESGT